MPRRRSTRLLILAIIVGLSGSLAYTAATRLAQSHAAAPPVAVAAPVDSVTLVAGEPNTLAIPAAVAQAMGVRTAEVETAPSQRPLVLSGSLGLDPNKLISIHTRFPGEVMSIGMVLDKSLSQAPLSPGEAPRMRPCNSAIPSKRINSWP